MTLDQLRNHMNEYRRLVDAEAAASKDSYLALERLAQLYQRFDDEERILANQVLGEWVGSTDENLRFDALALIADFGIAAAVPSLEALARRLASSAAPSAPFELQKVERVLTGLRHDG